MINTLIDKVAIVTGGAGGLGLEVTKCFLDEGYKVCIVDKDEHSFRNAVDASWGRTDQIFPIFADLASSADCESIVSQCIERFSRLDTLCNVAGFHAFHHFDKMGLYEWDRIMNINLRAPFIISRDAIPHLIETKGSIVNVVSASAFQGQAYSAAYCASKAGLLNMTKALAMEYIHDPIRINAVAPSGMNLGEPKTSRLPEDMDLSLIKRFIPLRNVIPPKEVAQSIVALSSNLYPSMHGTCLTIDNGALAG